MEDLIFQSIMGLTTGMCLWMIAASLAIAFGVLGILNVAQGSLYMVGGFISYTFYNSLGMNFAISIILTIITVAIIGLLMERFLFRPIYGKSLEIQLLLTFALVFIFDNTTRLIWGAEFISLEIPSLLKGTISIVDRQLPIYSLVILGAGIAVFFVIWFFLSKTWWGKEVRATSSDREMANALGINTRTLFSLAFMIAAGISGLGGALVLPGKVITPGLGGDMIILAFVVVIIGTLGNITGAFLGSLIVGVVIALAAGFFPGMETYAPYLVMVIVLIIRPRGIFGRVA